jgi:decaprenylphospho-beta-D-ribofuranose 2-oxidase
MGVRRFMAMIDERLAGWGRLPVVHAPQACPVSANELSSSWSASGSRISRGLGRAYGDAALPVAGGFALSALGMARMVSFDEATGLLVAESGVSLAEIIEVFLPRGWFLPVVPGTKFVTLGGAVAADIHGKNHHVDGTLGVHVAWLELLLPTGGLLRCSSSEEAPVFRATIGGMGLTGHIARVAIRLRRVPSAWCKVRTLRGRDLDHTLDLLAANDGAYRHSVAWMDCVAVGDKLGRGVLMLGNEALPAELPARAASSPHRLPTKAKLAVPFDLPAFALGPLTVAAFNAAYYGLAKESEQLVDFEKFFFPLDAIRDWNRIYGRRGFSQFQAYFPDATARDGLHACLAAIGRSRQASFLAVLKRSGPANDFPLSFLDLGYTLALDLPGPEKALAPLMAELDAILAAYHGKVYFAKDAFVSPSLIPAMYPRLDEFRRVQRALDPSGNMRSLLSTRLKLHD